MIGQAKRAGGCRLPGLADGAAPVALVAADTVSTSRRGSLPLFFMKKEYSLAIVILLLYNIIVPKGTETGRGSRLRVIPSLKLGASRRTDMEIAIVLLTLIYLIVHESNGKDGNDHRKKRP